MDAVNDTTIPYSEIPAAAEEIFVLFFGFHSGLLFWQCRAVY